MGINFLNQNVFWPVVICSILLWVVFLWKEWSQSGKPRFLIKVLISFLALISLAAIALKPTMLKEMNTKLGIITAKGYNSKKLDSLISAHKGIKLIKYQANKPLKKYTDSLSSLFVLGQGLKSFDLWQLDSIPTVYLGEGVSKGISRLKYNQENRIGSKLVVDGLYNKPKIGNRLILKEVGGSKLDSITLNDEDQQRFHLEANLSVKGKYVYTLEEKDSLGETLSTEPLPIKVMARDTLKVLIVNNFPTFETKYLKNYLAEMGHQVLVRSQITKNRYKFEYFNRDRTPIYTFSEDNLNDFDLLIIDASSYKNLSSKSLAALNTSIRETGLGLFVQPDLNYFSLPRNTSHFNFRRNESVEVNANDTGTKFNKHPFVFADDITLQTSYSSSKQTLAGYKRMRKGRIGTTILENTYELVLKGQKEVYQQLWKSIIEDVSKKTISAAQWNTNSIFAYKDQPFHFNVRTEIENPEVMINDKYRVPLIRDVDITSLWKGTTYPRNMGWNKLVLQNDTSQVFEFFVMDSTKWRSLYAYNTINQNRRHFNKPISEIKKVKVKQEINPIWFYLLFLLSMGYLWLEPKLYGN